MEEEKPVYHYVVEEKKANFNIYDFFCIYLGSKNSVTKSTISYFDCKFEDDVENRLILSGGRALNDYINYVFFSKNRENLFKKVYVLPNESDYSIIIDIDRIKSNIIKKGFKNIIDFIPDVNILINECKEGLSSENQQLRRLLVYIMKFYQFMSGQFNRVYDSLSPNILDQEERDSFEFILELIKHVYKNTGRDYNNDLNNFLDEKFQDMEKLKEILDYTLYISKRGKSHYESISYENNFMYSPIKQMKKISKKVKQFSSMQIDYKYYINIDFMIAIYDYLIRNSEFHKKNLVIYQDMLDNFCKNHIELTEDQRGSFNNFFRSARKFFEKGFGKRFDEFKTLFFFFEGFIKSNYERKDLFEVDNPEWDLTQNEKNIITKAFQFFEIIDSLPIFEDMINISKNYNGFLYHLTHTMNQINYVNSFFESSIPETIRNKMNFEIMNKTNINDVLINSIDDGEKLFKRYINESLDNFDNLITDEKTYLDIINGLQNNNYESIKNKIKGSSQITILGEGLNPREIHISTLEYDAESPFMIKDNMIVLSEFYERIFLKNIANYSLHMDKMTIIELIDSFINLINNKNVDYENKIRYYEKNTNIQKIRILMFIISQDLEICIILYHII